MQKSESLDYSDLGIELFEHQENCINNLNEEFIHDSRERGMIVVPTGGGKTTIASSWIIKNILDQGYNVLWLSHLIVLLRQAKETFQEYLSTKHNKKYDNLLVISSEDNSWDDMNENNKIIFCTDKTAAKNLNSIESLIDNSEKGLALVVDEAHHSLTSTYLKIIKNANEYTTNSNKELLLLGLTATPFKLDPKKTINLWQLYDDSCELEDVLFNDTDDDNNDFDQFVYNVSNRSLIRRGILADPQIENIDTSVMIELDGIKDFEFEIIKENNPIDSEIINELARLSARNEYIVKTYKKNKIKYGKTIVFAINIFHAKTLEDEFKNQNINARAIHHNLNDKENKRIIEKYKNDDSLDVIINVLKLTEGFDAPKTKTVFITKPTKSEILVKQMVGRAMRGPLIGGTEIANLVTFVDTWADFHPVNTNLVIDKEQSGEDIILDDPNKSGTNNQRENNDSISEKLLLTIYEISKEKNTQILISSKYQVLPYAWLYWEKETEDDHNINENQNLLIFENQSIHFEKLGKHILENPNSSKESLDNSFDTFYDKFFKDCPYPKPSRHKLKSMIHTFIENKDKIKYFHYKNREYHDPSKIAQEFVEKDLGFREIISKTKKLFDNNSIYRTLYNGHEDLKADIIKKMENIYNKKLFNEKDINFDTYDFQELKDFDTDTNPLYNLKANADALIYSKKYPYKHYINTLIHLPHLNTSFPTDKKNMDESGISHFSQSTRDLINFYDKIYPDFDEKNIENIDLSEEQGNPHINFNIALEERMNIKDKKKKDELDRNLFPEGPPEYNDIYYSEHEVNYLGTFRKSDNNIIINKKLYSPSVPLFLLQYIIFKQLIKADMKNNTQSDILYKRLKGFNPSIYAKREVYNRDPNLIEDLKIEVNFWYKISEKFIDNIETNETKHYKLKQLFGNY